MLVAELSARYPELVHVTFARAWDGILRNGLWSAEALATRLQQSPDIRESLLSRRRPVVRSFDHEVLGRVTFRDHKAIPARGLGGAVVGMTEEQWYRELSRRVFFYPRAEDGAILIAAYPAEPQVMITIDTQRLLTHCGDRVAVSSINTGYAMRRPVPRGSATFVALGEFPSDRLSNITEITVEDGIESIDEMVVAVRALAGGAWTTLWPG